MENPKPIRGLFKNNRLSHETVKFQVAYILMNKGFEVYPECTFKSGGRADLVAIQNGVGYAIEILDSETNEKFGLKKDYYPEQLTLVKIHVKDFDPNTWTI